MKFLCIGIEDIGFRAGLLRSCLRNTCVACSVTAVWFVPEAELSPDTAHDFQFLLHSPLPYSQTAAFPEHSDIWSQ